MSCTFTTMAADDLATQEAGALATAESLPSYPGIVRFQHKVMIKSREILKPRDRCLSILCYIYVCNFTGGATTAELSAKCHKIRKV